MSKPSVISTSHPLNEMSKETLQDWVSEIGIKLDVITADSEGDKIVVAGLIAQRREIWAELACRARNEVSP